MSPYGAAGTDAWLVNAIDEDREEWRQKAEAAITEREEVIADNCHAAHFVAQAQELLGEYLLKVDDQNVVAVLHQALHCLQSAVAALEGDK